MSKLRIKAGEYYLRRDWEIVGPAEGSPLSFYDFIIDHLGYRSNGEVNPYGPKDSRCLIKHIPKDDPRHPESDLVGDGCRIVGPLEFLKNDDECFYHPGSFWIGDIHRVGQQAGIEHIYRRRIETPEPPADDLTDLCTTANVTAHPDCPTYAGDLANWLSNT